MLFERYSRCYFEFDALATVSMYKSVLSELNSNYDQAVVFSKGHRGVPYGNHFSLLDHWEIGLIDYAYFPSNVI